MVQCVKQFLKQILSLVFSKRTKPIQPLIFLELDTKLIIEKVMVR